jgi:hypothetical protein
MLPAQKYAVKSKLTHSVENALSLADDGDIAGELLFPFTHSSFNETLSSKADSLPLTLGSVPR